MITRGGWLVNVFAGRNERGTGGTHHDEADIRSNFIIEFDKNGNAWINAKINL